MKNPPETKRPDDVTSPLVVCSGTERLPGCGHEFHSRCIHPRTLKVTGRSRCPKCGKLRQIPAELHEMYVRWFGMVSQYTRRAVRNGMPEDVAEGVIHDAYLEAVLRWVPELGALSTYATFRMNSAINAAVKLLKRQPIFSQADFDRIALQSHDSDELEDAEEAAVREQKIAAALNQLDPRSADIIRARFGFDGDPCSLKLTGEAYGLTRERVRQIEAETLTKLRKLLK